MTRKQRTRINEYRATAAGNQVQALSIAGTDLVVFSAWRPVASIMSSPCSTFTSIGGLRYGRIGTDPDRQRYEGLPVMSDERIAAAVGAYFDRYEVAYAEILSVYPGLACADMVRRDGEILVGCEVGEAVVAEARRK